MAKKKNNGRKASANKRKRQTEATSYSPPSTGSLVDELTALNLEVSVSLLLLLPFELREKIYAYLLDTKYASSSRSSEYHGFVRLQATSPPFQICTEILCVNKQMHSECLNTLYSSNMFVRLSMYNDNIEWTQSLLQQSDVGFVCSNPDLVERIKGHALDVRLIQEKSKILRGQVVFPAIFLSRFVKFLKTICDAVPKWGKDHAIHLYLRQRYPTGPMTAEGLLLEPWRKLHGLQNVVVGTTLVATEYANDLKTAMMETFNPERWLESVVKMKDAGVQEFSIGNYEGAIETFASIGPLLEQVLQSSHGGTLVSQSQQFSQAINKLRYQSELNLAKCYVIRPKMPWEEAFGIKSQWKEVFLAAFRAVTLAEHSQAHMLWAKCAPSIPANDPNGYTVEERNDARLCRAAVLTEIGEHNMAILDLQAALEDAPGDIKIQSAMDKAVKKFDSRQRMGAALRALGVPGF